eukprot:s3646_g1.t1
MAPRNRRGPERARGSAVKIKCAFKRCRSGRDCKNIGASLQVNRAGIDETMCRKLRNHNGLVKFCCLSHKNKCLNTQCANARGPREVLDEEQVVALFHTLVNQGAAWAAVMMLFQIFRAERCDCVRQIKVSWLDNFDPNLASPASVKISKINGKTVERSVAVTTAFASMIYAWLHCEPLKSGKTQWPFPGQPVEKANTFLFPGLYTSGPRRNQRTWGRAVSQRAYLDQVRKAARFLTKERAEFRRAQRPHVFDECSLQHLGTHSFKRTGVSLLKNQCRSTSVVASISGTSRATLEKIYDTPTRKRQRSASEAAFDGIVHNVNNKKSKKTAKEQTSKFQINFCAKCGVKRQDATWMWCPACGQAYA